ncbi:MAG TPA: chloride channel protein [Terriglobales bacterium]|nr:chloride channel protein [Terriglobales bacterium]
MSDLSPIPPEVSGLSPQEDVGPPTKGGQRWFFAAAPLSEERFFLILAVFVGIFSGLAVVCFRLAIEWTGIGILGPAPEPHNLRVLLAPALGGLVTAILVVHLFPLVRGSGVNQTKAALYIFNGYIPFRTAVGKFITAAIAIGSGHSLGLEDPSLQIGASIASALGRHMDFSRDKLRLLAPIGAAAGLAAAFNAPISAVLFVIEEVIGRWSTAILGSVVLSAISSVVVVRGFLGAQPLFRIPALTVFRPAELLAYIVLGIVGGFAAVVFAKAIGYLRPLLRALPAPTQYLQPALAGLLIGLIGYLGAPQVMGAGYEYIDQAMHDQFTWKILAILAGLKILATTLSFVTGTPGGMFAPTLFVGAMLGGAVGGVERHFYPHLAGTTGTYALVGMGVLFAGFLRAPMTSVFMVIELSGDYSIIVPVIVANAFAYFISRSFQPVPIFDLLTRQDGLELPSLEELREETTLHVEDAMKSPPAPVLNSQETVHHAVAQIQGSASNLFLVCLKPTGWTSINREVLQRFVSEGKGDTTLGSLLASQQLPYLHPDNPLDMALRYVHQTPLVPVVSRADLRKLEGVISSEDVLAKYRAVVN